MVDEPELVKFARSCGEAYAFCGDEIVKIWKLGLAAGRAEARERRKNLKKLTRLSEEYGGYAELETPPPEGETP